MGKKNLIEKLTKKLKREPTAQEIETAKQLLQAKKRAAAQAAPAEATETATAPAAAPTAPAAAPTAPAAAASEPGTSSGQKRAADAPAAAPGAARAPKKPKSLPQKESPEYLAALMTTIEKFESAAKLPKVLADTLRATKEPPSSSKLPYRGYIEQMMKQTAECVSLMEEASKFLGVDQQPE
mmetsp:Transcript_10754/g.21812  ORF Transcript_10754/g.21812 Transcript_10754/m.21812 type:complete len:182 (+) Transcript_10754:66-611(+)